MSYSWEVECVYCTRCHWFLHGNDSNCRHSVEEENEHLKEIFFKLNPLFPFWQNYTLLVWESRCKHLRKLTMVKKEGWRPCMINNISCIEICIYKNASSSEKISFLFYPQYLQKHSGNQKSLSAKYHIFKLRHGVHQNRTSL